MKALSENRQPLQHFLNLKYPMEIMEDEGAWTASIPDLPGCVSFGDTVAEAVENVQKTKELWIQGQYESNAEIPEPTDEEGFSGKFVLRIPKTLHRSLAYEARRQGVSLNHYASHLLSQRQPLNAFNNLAQSLLSSCLGAGSWRMSWAYGRHEHGRTFLMGQVSANPDFLIDLRKPPAQYNYKALLSPAIRKQYLRK